MSTAPWDIYEQSLSAFNQGRALWAPEPSAEFGPVRLGDVGYISRGRFCFMFNTTVGANDSQNINKRGVPIGHIPFSYLTHNVLTETLERNDFCGAGIQSPSGNRTVSVPTQDVGSDVTASGSTYKCTASSGALLLVNGRARSELLSCDKAIRDYIFQHFSSWVDFARNTLGIDLEARDILFIHGFTKSAQWGTVAFYDANPGNSRLIITGGGFAAGSNDEQWHVTMSGAPNAMVFARAGPMDRAPDRRRTSPNDELMDQCIFIQYYWVKTNFFRRSLRAAAGPHNLLHDPRGDWSTACIARCPALSCDEQADEGITLKHRDFGGVQDAPRVTPQHQEIHPRPSSSLLLSRPQSIQSNHRTTGTSTRFLEASDSLPTRSPSETRGDTTYWALLRHRGTMCGHDIPSFAYPTPGSLPLVF